uniref:Uncharacterized protein n=1 Tax=Xiphophorus couchianus TaxID=32473 RepID=A0A3B5LHQ4_9TELE
KKKKKKKKKKKQARENINNNIVQFCADGLNVENSLILDCTVKDFNNMTCNKAGTVEESLKNSPKFAKTAEKNKEKELVIIRDGKAISPHLPCTLIKKGDRLTVKYVKAVERPKKPIGAYVSLCRNKPPSNLVMFHVLTKGGKNIVRIMKNSALRAFQEISVYAYKGERVKAALKRDGRLHSSIFKKNFVLSNKSTSVKTELSNPVDELNDETFQIILLDKSDPPPSLPVKQKLEPNQEMTPRNLVLEIPNSKRTQNQLCFQFEKFVKGIKTLVPTLSHFQNLFRVDFGQSTQMCSEVRTMKRLMCLSDSAGQVRINGQPNGSGFLLFGNYAFTNGHVVKDIYDKQRSQFNEKVSVHFSYESVDQTEGALDVLELVCFELKPDVPGGDWALLKLSAHQRLPPGLLEHIGFPPKDGGICIIGHPEGGVKKIDPCLIVPSQNRLQVVERHYRENQGPVQFVTRSFFEGVATSVDRKSFLTYESCFYYASSGSPVFDKHCNVVAMHSGGYIYRSANGETKSVIEFAHPLLAIMERLIIQMTLKVLWFVKLFICLENFHILSSYNQTS